MTCYTCLVWASPFFQPPLSLVLLCYPPLLSYHMSSTIFSHPHLRPLSIPKLWILYGFLASKYTPDYTHNFKNPKLGFTSEREHVAFVFPGLGTSLGMVSNSIIVPAKFIISFSSTAKLNCIVHIWHIFITHSPIAEHLDWLHNPHTMNTEAKNTDMQISLCWGLKVTVYTPRRNIVTF